MGPLNLLDLRLEIYHFGALHSRIVMSLQVTVQIEGQWESLEKNDPSWCWLFLRAGYHQIHPPRFWNTNSPSINQPPPAPCSRALAAHGQRKTPCSLKCQHSLRCTALVLAHGFLGDTSPLKRIGWNLKGSLQNEQTKTSSTDQPSTCLKSKPFHFKAPTGLFLSLWFRYRYLVEDCKNTSILKLVFASISHMGTYIQYQIWEV